MPKNIFKMPKKISYKCQKNAKKYIKDAKHARKYIQNAKKYKNAQKIS